MIERAEFHKLLLTRVRLLTEDAVGLTFLVPDDLRAAYKFLPGQYLTLQREINGELLRRPYSIASGINQPSRLEVGIRRVEGGRFSSYANRMSAGIMLDVMTPQGQFIADPVNIELGASRHILVVAAGSGITPCLSIIKSLLCNDPAAVFTLVFGNRTSQSVMFADDINALQERYSERFTVIHVMSRESTSSPLFQGYIDGQHLGNLVGAGLLAADGWHAAYCCGPSEMLDEVIAWLANVGLSQNAIHRELFATPGQQNSNKAITNAANSYEVAAAGTEQDCNDNGENTNVPVTIHIGGAAQHITVRGASETILAAATRQGVDLPFSCAGGMCCTCRCKLLAGVVSMDANYSLAKREVDEGYVLACQARARGASLEIDFDAA